MAPLSFSIISKVLEPYSSTNALDILFERRNISNLSEVTPQLSEELEIIKHRSLLCVCKTASSPKMAHSTPLFFRATQIVSAKASSPQSIIKFDIVNLRRKVAFIVPMYFILYNSTTCK